jgi:hypothetical protein
VIDKDGDEPFGVLIAAEQNAKPGWDRTKPTGSGDVKRAPVTRRVIKTQSRSADALPSRQWNVITSLGGFAPSRD